MTTTDQETVPLDFSSYETPPEHPDVIALKERVRQVARKYKDRHGWCSEVDRALAEMGVEASRSSAKIAPVKIHTTFGPVLDIKVDPSLFIGKPLQEQWSALAATISPIRLEVPGCGTSTMTVTPEMISAVEVTPKPPEMVKVEDDRYVWRYGSSEGRVLHAYDAEEFRVMDGYALIYSLCRRTSAYVTYLTEISTRGTGNRCLACDTRAANG